ncbi:MAG: peptidylprolyl isomerase [Candidatus Wallbacteria bacterium]|nr:peptidylprolyl isomerase [Candidatus Wallbacteria bacterium]
MRNDPRPSVLGGWGLLRRRVVLLALLAGATLTVTAETPPRVGDERLVLRTVAGDLVLALYPDVAPRHVAQVLKLARLGVYDTTNFFRVDPAFLVQIADARERSTALTPEQRQAVVPLKAELSALKHRRGTLTMAHQDNDPDSAETSFSVLLADSPHLDGKYTIFGHLEIGWETIEEFLRVPRTSSHRPVVKLEIRQAQVVLASKLAASSIGPARVVPVPDAFLRAAAAAEAAAAARKYTPPDIAGGILLMVLLDLLGWAGQERLPRRALASLCLMNVLVGAFLCFVVLTPSGSSSPTLAVLLFAGLLGTIKLMGRLES